MGPQVSRGQVAILLQPGLWGKGCGLEHPHLAQGEPLPLTAPGTHAWLGVERAMSSQPGSGSGSGRTPRLDPNSGPGPSMADPLGGVGSHSSTLWL